MTDGPMRALQIGVAQLLAAHGLAVYKPASPYTATDVAVAFDIVPPAPDQCVTLSIYNVDSHTWDDIDIVSMQFRYRGPAGVVNNRADAVFGLLHASGHQVLNGISVADITRQNTAQLGQDQNKRFERVCNYELIINNPTPNRP